ncbi:IS110-like element ISPa49 family transposase [Pseudomonas aeruginosa]|uniref:IS110-like element ISPa49 family transposase n=1 Tax=Pseudomonas aeruginosa TaxID=287 RepID=UPI00050FD5A6|nr:IS110-like element ISPa49 family transposase [Pseudomonas aeruginosa]KGB84917.1 transposase [Pseudomonas aeruginosa]
MSLSQTIVGIDIAKSVFQIHEVDKETGEVTSRQIKRARLLQHFINREPCFIGMEACGGAQHWARQFVAMGHTVKLLPAQSVRPFAGGNKNDIADARAIWIAVQQPGIKAVAIKTEAQQAVLALHRIRQQLVKFRTAQINALRGLLAEYGEVMPLGRDAVAKALPSVFARLVDRLPGVLIESLREQYTRIAQLDKEVSNIERRLREWHRDDESCRRITSIPGVGLLTATATVAAMGDPGAFSSGREFAAWLGLVPRQTGTGGRVKLLGISKRGDRYLRTLLIHGARSVLMTSKTPPAWAVNLATRRPLNVAVVALANKMARTLWALLAHQREFQPEYVSRPA